MSCPLRRAVLHLTHETNWADVHTAFFVYRGQAVLTRDEGETSDVAKLPPYRGGWLHMSVLIKPTGTIPTLALFQLWAITGKFLGGWNNTCNLHQLLIWHYTASPVSQGTQRLYHWCKLWITGCIVPVFIVSWIGYHWLLSPISLFLDTEIPLCFTAHQG